jgi:predicted nuclease of predicted toxin-antitoxin system
MFPTATAMMLRDTHGHDAVHVAEIGLRGAEDAQVAATARAEGWVVVTENVANFAAERDIVLVLVLRACLVWWSASVRITDCDRSVVVAAGA